MPTHPVRRVAVLSDVHGNLPALEAVLAEVDRLAVDRVVVNGDAAAGPCPDETLDRLLGLGERAVWVRGNADRAMVECFDGADGGDPVDRWAATRISRAHRDHLARLPLTATVDVAGRGSVTFCHATARADGQVFLVDATAAQFRDAFGLVAACGVVVLGHTHMPFDRLFDGRRVVNAGSVGMPYGHAGASWLLLGPDVVLRRTAYDVGAAAARLGRSAMPGIRAFIADHVRASPGDVEAMAALRPQRLRVGSIVIHCHAFDRMMAFWQAALGYVPREPAAGGWVVLRDPAGTGPNLSLQARDHPRPARGWIHLDLYTPDQGREVDRLVSLGATRYPWRYQPGDDFVVLADPDGNLFCVVRKSR